MSDFSNGKGIHTYTVQEAVNQHLGKVIHTTPGVLVGTTHANDVMFDGIAEIENAVSYKGGTSRLVAISVTDYDNPSISIWKAKRGITNNQGNFGQAVTRDIYAMCSYPDYSGDDFFTESFDNLEGGYRSRTGSSGEAVVETG